MKTPREILLEQHRSSEPKLDALRQQVVATELANQSAPVPSPSPFRFRCSMLDVRCLFSALLWLPMKLWMELVWPCRRIWAGLAAVWVLVFLLNLDFSGPTASMAANRGPTTNPWSMAALREQQLIMSQLLDAETPASEPAPKLGPRGEKRAQISIG